MFAEDEVDFKNVRGLTSRFNEQVVKEKKGPCLLLYHRLMLSGEGRGFRAGWWGPGVHY